MDRTGKELLIASKTFASENRLKSWWCLWSTIGLVAILFCLATFERVPMLASVSASILMGFVLVRLFVIYHDFFHGAILSKSKIAFFVLYSFGLIVLSPARNWKHTHDLHHKHNSNQFGAEIGGFPLMTTVEYRNSSFWQRLGYRVVRSPLVILFGYITNFFINKTLMRFVMSPKNNVSCGVALLIHFGLILLFGLISLKTLFLGMFIPLFIGSALGTYLFYAQHNFPGMKRKAGREWDYVYAALYSSSYLQLGPVMNWLTGNIGYHHVHHLNAKIPFYRLPEAMGGLAELQEPIRTSLGILDIFRCLQLKLWDPISEQLLTFRQARLQGIQS